MRKFLVSTLLISILSVFTVIGVGAVTFGQPDGNAHPYVGTLLFKQNNDGFFSCTGTLLSPTVMLTAGHCVEGGGVVNSETYVRFDENALAGRSNYNSTQDWLDGDWIAAEQVIPHPQFADYAQFPNTYDVGIVILSVPVNLPQYGALPSLGYLDSVLAERGNSTNRFTAVGYGVQGVLRPFAADEYARYQGSTRLTELNSTFNGDSQSAKFSNNPGQGNGGPGGSCFGDSGGPIFRSGTNIVTAVVSFGFTPCIGVDFQFRMDTAVALDFVAPYVGQ